MSIFNGKDLTGWQGLVENPISRAKLSKSALSQKQAEANAKAKSNWIVKDETIVSLGNGANLSTLRAYGDFELLLDWKVSNNGSGGIYLRGVPQIKIGAAANGAQVGSGGLYNNQKERNTPLALADNPVGEWNTFHIKVIGNEATIYLNGVLPKIIIHNGWDIATTQFMARLSQKPLQIQQLQRSGLFF